MSVPPIEVLNEAAKSILIDAHADGKLSQMTQKQVLRRIEEQLSLEDKALKHADNKDKLLEFIVRTVAELRGKRKADPNTDANLVSSTQTQAKTDNSKKRNGDQVRSVESHTKLDAPNESPRQKAKPITVKNPAPSLESNHDSDTESEDIHSSKRQKLGSGTSKRKDSNIKYKSKEFLSTSDIDGEETDSFNRNDIRKPSTGPQHSSTSQRPNKKSAEPKNSTSTNKHRKERDDSDISMTVDEPSRVNKKKEKTKRGDKRNPKQELSKDEERVKRLKSLVLACGVRKVWSKFFNNDETPAEQIRVLKKLLADLGMSGRMSLEQARAIKEKRELEDELADVQTFEQSILKQSIRRNATIVRARADSVESDTVIHHESSDEAPPVGRKVKNARQSIMAFLADQSDSD